MTKNQTERIQELEKLMKKVIKHAFKDNTLDYTVQISSTSMEPGKVKYGFMINGTKKELVPVAMSFDTYEECKNHLAALLETVDPVELEKLFHRGRINVYTNAISSHQERLKTLEENPEQAREDAELEMEEV